MALHEIRIMECNVSPHIRNHYDSYLCKIIQISVYWIIFMELCGKQLW